MELAQEIVQEIAEKIGKSQDEIWHEMNDYIRWDQRIRTTTATHTIANTSYEYIHEILRYIITEIQAQILDQRRRQEDPDAKW